MSKSAAGEEPPPELPPPCPDSARPDVLKVLSEVSACVLWTVVLLLMVSAFGLFKVNPPGEEELCTLQTLGLVNATETKQDTVLFACHGLYKTVFLFSRSFSAAFLALGLLPLGLLGLARGAHLRAGAAAACRYVWSAVLNALAVAILWFPSAWLLSLSASVTLVMAPITAQWLVIYAAYFGMKASHHQPPHWLEIVYQGYVACWYEDTFLWAGTMAVLLLWGFSIADLARNVLAAFGLRPRYGDGDGFEVCRLRRRWCAKARQSLSSCRAGLHSSCADLQEKGCSGCCASLGQSCSSLAALCRERCGSCCGGAPRPEQTEEATASEYQRL